MLKRIFERGHRVGSAYALTTFARLQDGCAEDVEAYLSALPTGADSPFARIGTLHIARVISTLLVWAADDSWDSAESAGGDRYSDESKRAEKDLLPSLPTPSALRPTIRNGYRQSTSSTSLCTLVL